MAGKDISRTRSAHGGSEAGPGLAAAIGAFAIWGLFPLYLKPLAGVPSMQIMAHRIVWCCLMVYAWLAVRGELGTVRAALADRPSRRRLTASVTRAARNRSATTSFRLSVRCSSTVAAPQ